MKTWVNRCSPLRRLLLKDPGLPEDKNYESVSKRIMNKVPNFLS